MDQDSFRQLLQGSASARKPAANGASSNPKKGKTYRTQSSISGSECLQRVEALAEDFERRNADQDRAVVEEQRQYLGGDSEHTVLVKGLDFALLEQNKARAAAATEDDDALEQVFAEVVQPKKRTREDIVNELRNKRQKSDVAGESTSPPVPDIPLDDAKKAGKFKPIGFKPIGSSEAKKKKKVKVKKDDAGAGTKKKTSSKTKPAAAQSTEAAASSQAEIASTSTPAPAPPKSEPEPEPADEDFDIFEGAGEYTGIDLGDDDKDDESDGEIKDDDDTDRPQKTTAHEEEAPARGRWFDTEEPQPELPRRPSTPPPAKSHSPSAPAEREEGEAEEEEEAPVRLAPLASSSIPSIREFLAMDMETEKQAKRQERRDKKKGKAKRVGDDDDD
ncbi:hypothetical protein EIP86_005412 [Pleurotus ostreatoroseus]|nr:hypothetical protein EIP86_005412 [Pleurotus ostreatoroseus]